MPANAFGYSGMSGKSQIEAEGFEGADLGWVKVE